MRTTANSHPKEGVFWILTKNPNFIKQWNFQFIFDFAVMKVTIPSGISNKNFIRNYLAMTMNFFRAEEYGKITLIRKSLIQFSFLAY